MASTSSFHIIPIITLLAASQAVNALNPDDLLNKPTGTGNSTVHDEIQCYALPYGAIGFASHILTYMTVICLSLGRNPLIPCLRLRNRKFNLTVSVLGFLVSFPLTVVTMVKCRNTWSFILIAVWKLVLSTTLTAMSIHAGRNIIDVPKQKTLKKKKKARRKKNKNSSRSSSIPLTARYLHLEPPRNSYSGRNSSSSRVPSPFGSPSPYLSPSSPGYSYSPHSPGQGSYFTRPGGQYNQLNHHHHEIDSDDEEPYPYSSPSSDGEAEEHLQAAQQKIIYKHIWQDPQYRSQFRKIWLWSPLYFFGAIVGFVGVMNIVRKNIATNQQLKIVTGVFGGIVLFIIIVVVVLFLCAFGKLTFSLVMGALVGIFVLTVLFALYTDWALACLVGDVVGRPSRDNAVFYWCYFAAKRLPMLSF